MHIQNSLCIAGVWMVARVLYKLQVPATRDARRLEEYNPKSTVILPKWGKC